MTDDQLHAQDKNIIALVDEVIRGETAAQAIARAIARAILDDTPPDLEAFAAWATAAEALRVEISHKRMDCG
jgi:hypothetical protein